MFLLHFRDLITTFTRPRRVNVTLSPMGLVLSRRLRPALITISICAGPGAGIPWIPGSGFRSSSLPVSRGSRGRDSVGSGVLVFRSSGAPGVPGLGFRGFWGSGLLVFRSSGLRRGGGPGAGFPGILGFRSSGLRVFRGPLQRAVCNDYCSACCREVPAVPVGCLPSFLKHFQIEFSLNFNFQSARARHAGQLQSCTAAHLQRRTRSENAGTGGEPAARMPGPAANPQRECRDRRRARSENAGTSGEPAAKLQGPAANPQRECRDQRRTRSEHIVHIACGRAVRHGTTCSSVSCI